VPDSSGNRRARALLVRVGGPLTVWRRRLSLFVLISTGLVAVCAQSSADTAANSAAYRMCGRISSRYGPFAVYIKRGRVSCSQARSVIKYVTSHGMPTQGTPGTSPRGWNCDYGYGRYRGNPRIARAGPECISGARTVEGVGPGWTPA